MYRWEIVEERDHPITMGRHNFKKSPNMRTVVLLLRLNISIWSTGRTLIMDSMSCVLKGILEMSKGGVVVSH